MAGNPGSCHFCGAKWDGTGLAHCKGNGKGSGCHESFGSDSAFDRHRRNFKCIPAEDFGKPRGPKSNEPRLVKHPETGLWVGVLMPSSVVEVVPSAT